MTPGPSITAVASRLALGLALTWLGCRPPPTTPTTPPTNDASSAAQPDDTDSEGLDPEAFFVRGVGEGVTAEDAYAEAVAQLETAFLGDGPLAETMDVPIHDPASDALHRQPAEGGLHRAIVGLTRERVEEVFGLLEQNPWQLELPIAIAQSLNELSRSYLAATLCHRRQALLQTECDQPPPETVAEGVTPLAETIELRPKYEDGVPVDAEGHPLSPAIIVAEQLTADGRWIPLANLPVTAHQPEGEATFEATEIASNAQGLVRLDLDQDQPMPPSLQLALDRQRLAGPLAEQWPPQELTLTGRPMSINRWTLVPQVRVRGRDATSEHFADCLGQALSAQGVAPPSAMDAGLLRRLSAAPRAQVGAMLSQVAQSGEGNIDFLVRVEFDSEFASRMGPYRLWYQARGWVTTYNVWTGEELSNIELTATASDVGDERADQAAQEQLAEQVASQLLDTLPRR